MKTSYLFSLMSIIVICSACQSKQATIGREEVTSQPEIISTAATILPTATKPIESLTRPTVTKVLPTAILSPTASPVFKQVSSPNPQPQLTGRLAFSSLGPDINNPRFRLYILNLVDNTLNQLTFGDVSHSQPSWSPDGKQIAFIARTSNNSTDIFIINDDGSEMKQLTNTPEEERSPRWSPDGSQIVFVFKEKLSSVEFVYIMNNDGSNGHPLTEIAGNAPSWSPDGRFITFSGYVDGGIFVYDMKTGVTTELLTHAPRGQYVPEDPKWIPDVSDYLISIRGSGDGCCPIWIYKMRLDDEKPQLNKYPMSIIEPFVFYPPVWGPSGKWFISTVKTARPSATTEEQTNSWELVAFSLKTLDSNKSFSQGEGTLITHNNFYDGDPDWTPYSNLTQQLKQPSPTPTITSTPALKKGTLEMKPIEINPDEANFDLDAGEVTHVNDPRADIEYHRYEGKGRQAMVGFGVVSVNKTKFSLDSQSITTYQDCLKVMPEFVDNYSVADVTYQYHNQSFCVLTNQNKLALLTFQQANENVVQFKYIISIDPIDVK